MLTSLSLKSKAVQAALESAPKKGVHVRMLLEREIGWKAWYAGPGGGVDHLLASREEQAKRTRIGDCEYYVGASKPSSRRLLGPDTSGCFGYHWHVGYVLDIHRPT
eukprot:gnl/TRDRNA2_/TRDRNA2_42877_c0_seq1.p1 gnl/TRDRNA2_/TRDRNA2_42877_c0~~gnl/TRDRNA2_/TRDRNA2_42877_c0_seq1.p1  ORF type:complete len:106 (-),score=13.46 gnl/TRDRNA2_/TRDRNA2_42877_c0_seq1:83-400(-)